jgi:putative isomerase
MMHKELRALVYSCERVNMGEIAVRYQRDAEELRDSIRKHCWDERDGFFYSVDLNLLPFEPRPFSGDPRLILHSG